MDFSIKEVFRVCLAHVLSVAIASGRCERSERDRLCGSSQT